MKAGLSRWWVLYVMFNCSMFNYCYDLHYVMYVTQTQMHSSINKHCKITIFSKRTSSMTMLYFHHLAKIAPLFACPLWDGASLHRGPGNWLGAEDATGAGYRHIYTVTDAAGHIYTVIDTSSCRSRQHAPARHCPTLLTDQPGLTNMTACKLCK